MSWYIDKLAREETFSLAMYGDGEWQAIFRYALGMKRFDHNAEKTVYEDELCELMTQSLTFNDPNFYFSTPNTFQVHPQFREYEIWADAVMKNLSVDIEFVEKNVWNEEMKAANLYPLIKQLQKMDVYVVSNKALQGLDFLKYKGFYEISYPNCWIDGSLLAAAEQIISDQKPGVYIVAAGIPAALLVQMCHGKVPNSWFIDLGSIWDGFVGIGAQRGFRAEMYADPERWKKWKKKNITGK